MFDPVSRIARGGYLLAVTRLLLRGGSSEAAGVDGFVGRRTELRLLESALNRARTGAGRLIVVTGPAGVGKTRFCAEGMDLARQAGFTVGWGSCWTDGDTPPLWPWQSILARLCGDSTAALLGGTGDADSRRPSRFVAVGNRLARACVDSPTMLVIDDCHAADPEAMLLTRFVARGLHDLPLVLVLTQRPGAAPPEVASLLARLEHDAVPIVLGGFDRDETRVLLTAEGVADPDPELLEAVHVVSRGNPLHLRRLVAMEVAANPQPAVGMPHGLGGVIDQLLRPLRPLTVRVLTSTAVLGASVSVSEAALMVDASHTAVLDALRDAARSGLVADTDTDSFTFSHELVRQALAARLTPNEQLAAHARAADILRVTVEGGSGERWGRLAHHALRAAPRSVGDARAAVAVCHAAACSMARHFAHEPAVALLSSAVGLHDDGTLGPVPAELLLDWAHVVLSAGQLAAAGSLLDRAIEAARKERNLPVFAEAALGLGGMWVNKFRGPTDRARVLARLDEALARLPKTATVLRCRLTARRSAELAYDSGTTGEVFSALRAARGTGDQQALAETLSLTHHALLRPEHGERRLAIADELIAVASSAGLEFLALVGMCRRTIDLFHLGDPRAERSLVDLRRRADEMNCRGVRFLHAAMEVMLLIRAGQLARAEQRATACLRLGTEIGDTDAPLYHGAHLFTIRWLQGRGAELVDLAARTANSPTLPEAELTFHAALALLATDAGQRDRARSALHRLTASGLAAIPTSSTWLACMFAVVEAAAALGEPDLARQAHDLLTPFAHLPIVASMAIVCVGSVERALGVAALTFGDLDRAVAHLDRAVDANIRLANRPFTACARADLAEALRRRGGAGGSARAAELLDLAIAEAAAMGMTTRARSWTATRQTLSDTIVISRDDGRWLLTHRGRSVLVDDLIGMRYLARLVANPGIEIPALDLVTELDHTTQSANHTVLDGRTRAAHAQRARELTRELAQARGATDHAQVQQLESELDALTTEVTRQTGTNNRPRHFGNPAERARTAVRKAITRAIDAIEPAEPEAANMLRAAVTTGYRCAYRPR
jgi:tetratricopeptide (TPR) repeat protein